MLLLGVIEKAVEAAALRGAEDALAKLGQAAQAVTPRKTGQLRGSFRVETTPPKTVTLVVGSPDHTPYAAVQERGINPKTGQPFRKYTTPGTGPHFVEHTLRQRHKDVIRDVAAEIRASLGRSL